jgi:hypothetical protein
MMVVESGIYRESYIIGKSVILHGLDRAKARIVVAEKKRDKNKMHATCLRAQQIVGSLHKPIEATVLYPAVIHAMNAQTSLKYYLNLSINYLSIQLFS